MTSYRTSSDPDIRAMQGLAQELMRLRATGSSEGTSFPLETSVGALAWAWGPRDPSGGEGWKYRLWYDDEKVVGWGWIYPPENVRISADDEEMSEATLVSSIRPDVRPSVINELIDWFVNEGGDGGRRVETGSADTTMMAALESHGFVRDPEAPWNLINRRTLEAVEEPRLPVGFSLKSMQTLGDVARRAAGHRTAWGSDTLTDERYARLMTTWPYRDDLDVVVEAPDGTIVACANIWFDEVNRTGEIEPFGTDPEYRGRGIGRALMLFGLQQLRAAGGAEAVVGCRGDDSYPIPKRLYHSVGFEEFERSELWKMR